MFATRPPGSSSHRHGAGGSLSAARSSTRKQRDEGSTQNEPQEETVAPEVRCLNDRAQTAG